MPVNSPQGLGRAPQAREQAAKAVGSSGKSVSDAKALKRDAPDLAEKVRNGKMTLNAATKERKKLQEPPTPSRRRGSYCGGTVLSRDLYPSICAMTASDSAASGGCRSTPSRRLSAGE